MTSTTPATSQSKPVSKNDSPPGPHHLATSKTLPIHPTSPSSTNSNSNSQSHSHSHTLSCSIPDGRRNSLGEPLHSSLETWTPNLSQALKRNQSWNRQDLKRAHVEEVLRKEEWSNDDGERGRGVGYWFEGVRVGEGGEGGK